MRTKKSPFKFLDAYQQEDRAIYFGRSEEIVALYDALSGVKHLLVYGPSGSGKTSLVECGLRNQYADADWLAITIRRGNDINQSFFAEINEVLDEKIELDAQTKLPVTAQVDFGQAIGKVFDEYFQPVYLLFDQFEELLLLGTSEEKQAFFTRLNILIRQRVPVRILLIMREEFIGHLSEFEALCPSIFKYRFRLEKMGRSNVRNVIFRTLEARPYKQLFEVEDSGSLADAVLDKLPDERQEIELTHVQVFLNELWDRAVKQTTGDELPIFNKDLINDDDDLAGILDTFFKKQQQQLTPKYDDTLPMEVLALMISRSHTKLQVSADELVTKLEENKVSHEGRLSDLLKDLEERRIIRPLKSGEATRYEISHDLLAKVVGQNLTHTIQLREEATEAYKVYMARKGDFTVDDLDFLRSYKRYKDYPAALEERIRRSQEILKSKELEAVETAKAQMEKEANLRKKADESFQKARKNARNANIIAIVAILAACIAGYSFKVARDKGIEAANALATNERNQKINTARELMLHGDSYRNLSKNIEAIEIYQAALDSLGEVKDSLKQRLEDKIDEIENTR